MSKKKRIQNQRAQKEVDARKRAETIFKVRSGLYSATEGACELGVSRKTYYQWENKGLTAMASALEDKDPGRPGASPENEKIKELQAKLDEANRLLEEGRIREHLKEEAWKLKVAIAEAKIKKKSGHKATGDADHRTQSKG